MFNFNKIINRSDAKILKHGQTKQDIARETVSRFSRGNIYMQTGAYLTRAELDEKAKEADKNLKELKTAFSGKF